MPFLLVRHRVSDFSEWKLVFDSHSETQLEAGLKVSHVWRNIDDPDEIVLLFEVADLQKARAFVSSPDVPEAKRQSGVLDNPDMYFLE